MNNKRARIALIYMRIINKQESIEYKYYTSKISTGPGELSEKFGFGTLKVPFTANRSCKPFVPNPANSSGKSRGCVSAYIKGVKICS